MSFVRKERRAATVKSDSQKRSGMKNKKKRVPAWDNSTTDLSVYKLSNEELERRRQIHKSANLPSIKAERQMRALLKVNRKRTDSTSACTDGSSLLQEILYDEEQLRDAVGYSDRIMSVVHDLCGDDPTMRSGKANVTLAPAGVGGREKSLKSRTLPDMTLNPSHLDVLSESVMDQQALNDHLEDDDDDEGNSSEGSGEEESSHSDDAYEGSLDLERFRRYIQKESEEKEGRKEMNEDPKERGRRSRRVSTKQRAARKSQQQVHKSSDEEAESADGGEEIHPAVRAINDTAKVKKKSRSRTGGGGGECVTPAEKNADLAMVIRGIKGEVKEYENMTGAQVLPDITGDDPSSTGTLYLLETIRALIHHLTEMERNGGNNSMSRLKSETEDQRSIINALTLELIKDQERLSKLEEAVKVMRLSGYSDAERPSNMTTTTTNYNPLQGVHPNQDHRTGAESTSGETHQVSSKSLGLSGHHLTQQGGHREAAQAMNGPPQNMLPSGQQDDQHRFVSLDGQRLLHDHLSTLNHLPVQDGLYHVRPPDGLQKATSTNVHLPQQGSRHREQQLNSVGGIGQNEHRHHREQQLNSVGGIGQNEHRHQERRPAPSSGHQEPQDVAGSGIVGYCSIPRGTNKTAFLVDQSAGTTFKADHSSSAAWKDSEWMRRGQQHTQQDGSRNVSLGNQQNQLEPLNGSKLVPTIGHDSLGVRTASLDSRASLNSLGLDQNDKIESNIQQHVMKSKADEFHANLGRVHHLENEAPVASNRRSNFPYTTSHLQPQEEGTSSRLDSHRSAIDAEHPQMQRVVSREQAIMLSPPRQMDRRSLFRAHGPMHVRRALYPDKTGHSKEQMLNASTGQGHHPLQKYEIQETTYHDIENTNRGGDGGNELNEKGRATTSALSSSHVVTSPLYQSDELRENQFIQSTAAYERRGTTADPDILEGVVVTSDRENALVGSSRNGELEAPSKTLLQQQADLSPLFSTDSHTSYRSLPPGGKFPLRHLSTDLSSAALDLPPSMGGIPGQGLLVHDAKRGTAVDGEEESALSAISDLNRRIAALSKEHADAEVRLQFLKNQETVQI